MALTEINSKSIKDGEIINADVNASAAIAGSKLADDSIAEAKLDISNAPSDGKFLQYKDSSDKLTWADVDTTTIPVADEDTDTTSFPVFTTGATGDQAPKTNEDKLKFNAGAGTLQATNLSTTGSGGKITAYGAAAGGGLTDSAFLDSNGITLSATAGGVCELRFQVSNVSTFVGFKPPTSGAGQIWELPPTDGSADQVLKTSGSGVLSWTDAGSGATGGGTEKIFWENGTTIDTDYTVGTSFGAACNAMSAGPITINTGKTVTVDAGDTWTIV
jgi:hypothetical protein